ncbi:hypothetical protein [Granulicella sp. dw_53]|uniref:hypothetical protein n=1 Tax=Granulicella sp. dw_53 TaxID=2719792 RepID=UPI001BD5C17E|nr:hypothetical protein [Granulicella sp. dw_53]
MHFHRLRGFLVSNTFVLLFGLFPVAGFGQQVVQRGAFGKPVQVYDETQLWTTPLMVQSDHDIEIYIPDVTSPDWLKLNYQNFEDRGQYVLSMFTFYKTTKACVASQIGWGYGDAEHLDACIDIGYRVRQAVIDTNLKTVTLLMAAMVGQDGQIDPASIQTQSLVRRWVELDPNTRVGLEKATEIVTKQMKIYDARLQSAR